jgi:hypothetical protein
MGSRRIQLMLLESFVSLAADYSLRKEALRETGPQFGAPLVESPASLFVAGAAHPFVHKLNRFGLNQVQTCRKATR